MLACNGVNDCFVNNLKASSSGCSKPRKETLLGPKRLWKNPIIFRSKRVKKATDKKINKHWINQDKKIISENNFTDIFSFED